MDMASGKKLDDKKSDDDAEQRRLHEAAAKCFGVIAGNGSRRSDNESVRQIVRERLLKRYGRK
jgi:hypothetical protein